MAQLDTESWLHSTNGVVDERFAELANAWKTSIGPTPTAMGMAMGMAMHPAYQQIIGMGPTAVPLLLAELEREPHHWFWALRSITGVDPVPESARGNLELMRDAWLQWGHAHGHLAKS